MHIRRLRSATAILASALILSNAAPAAEVSEIRAGAARVKITPTAIDMPPAYTKVNDDIYLRAAIIESGKKRAALVVIDAPTISAPVHDQLKQQIARTAKVPIDNVMLGTTHTHNSIRIDPSDTGILLPGSPKFVKQVQQAMLEALDAAEENMKPARFGVGKGKAYLVTSRNQWSHELGRYIEGVDRSGNLPADHSLGVLKLEGIDGKPIAYLANYAFNPVIAMAMKGAISGDMPGYAARYVERRLGDQAVVMFTVSAPSAPLYRSNPDEPVDPVYGNPDPVQLLEAMGTILGEEILATSKETRTSGALLPIAGASKKLVCPGKVTRPLNLPNRCAHTANSNLPACIFKDSDAPPVTLNMGLLRLGDLALVQADANPTAVLAQKFYQSMPLSNSWIVALTYGPMHYIMDDAGYVQNTYEATASTAKQGCAEQGFLNGAREMLARAK